MTCDDVRAPSSASWKFRLRRHELPTDHVDLNRPETTHIALTVQRPIASGNAVLELGIDNSEAGNDLEEIGIERA